MLTSDLTDGDRRRPEAYDDSPLGPLTGDSPDARDAGHAGDESAPTETGPSWGSLPAASRTRAIRVSVSGSIVGLIPFVLVLWDLRLAPLRHAALGGFGSNFFEVQARSLMHGHLSTPERSFGIEGFVIDGRTYTYFPPFPAILRMPVLLLTDRLDGRLTAPSMLLAWLVLAAGAAALLWNVRLVVRGARAVTRFEAALYAVLLASVTGGSIIVFDASLPWSYHEVYLWAVALMVAALSALIAFMRRPTLRRSLLTATLALGVVLTRTTSGWAVCLTVVGYALWRALRDEPARRAALTLAGGGVLALSVGVAINWAKFRHPYMFPLEHQVWTTQNARRRLALRINGGTITGTQFFGTTLVNYFRPDGIRFVPYFPFVTMPPEPAQAYGGAFLDQWYRTGSVPAFMPLLFCSTVWGFAVSFRRHAEAGFRRLRVSLLGALAVTGGVMFYGYVAHRYLNEFLPVLIVGASVGIVDVAGRLEHRPVALRRAAVAVIGLLATFGCVANAAVGLSAARLHRRGAELEQYVRWQLESARLAGTVDSLASQSDTLADESAADTLRVLGDCEALFVATGDRYEPWITVQTREFRVRATPLAGRPQLGALPLMRVDGLAHRTIALEADGRGRVRVRLGEGFFYLPSDWVEVDPERSVTVAVRLDGAENVFRIALNGAEAGTMPASELDESAQRTHVAIPSFAVPNRSDQTMVGYRLTPEFGPRLDLCQRVLDELDGER